MTNAACGRIFAAALLAGLYWAAPAGVALADTSGSEASSAQTADGGGQPRGARTDAPATKRRAAERVSRAGGAVAASGVEQPRAGAMAEAEPVLDEAPLDEVPAVRAPGRVRSSGRAADTGEADAAPPVRPLPAAASVSPAGDGGLAPGPAAAGSPVAASVGTDVTPRAARELPESVDSPLLTPSSLQSVPTPAPAAAAAAAVDGQGFCDDCWIFRPLDAAPPVLGVAAAGIDHALRSVSFTVERLVDSVGIWLSSLPASPVTEFLSGGLWLVRRSLFPVGSGVGMWGSVACLDTKDCSGQDLTGADFEGLDISDVDFTGANMTRSGFRGTKVENGRLAGANLKDATFVNANLRGADLTGVNLDGAAVLSGGDLLSASFTDFTGANFTDATMRGFGVVFNGATMANANFTNVNFGPGTTSFRSGWTNLNKSDLTGAIFSGANLERALLMGVKLSKADLTGANMKRAALNSADLTEANLAGATLYWTNLGDANLTGANLVGADLKGAIWRNTTCPDGSKTNTGCSAL